MEVLQNSHKFRHASLTEQNPQMFRAGTRTIYPYPYPHPHPFLFFSFTGHTRTPSAVAHGGTELAEVLIAYGYVKCRTVQNLQKVPVYTGKKRITAGIALCATYGTKPAKFYIYI